jgi:glutaredoxin-related protein
MSPEFRQQMDTLVNSHRVLVFMKGTKQFPQCGFSNTVVQVRAGAGVRLQRCPIAPAAGATHTLLLSPRPPSPPQILRAMDAPFETVNVLENDRVRTGMKEYSQVQQPVAPGRGLAGAASEWRRRRVGSRAMAAAGHSTACCAVGSVGWGPGLP